MQWNAFFSVKACLMGCGLTALLWVYPGCAKPPSLQYMPSFSQAASAASDTDQWITVFVHGIISVKPHITIPNIIRFINDTIDDTVYLDTVKIIRQNPFFFKSQAMQGLGLQKIDPARQEAGYASGLMAVAFEHVLGLIGKGADTAHHHYYTFGWSGLLSLSQRYVAGKLLYQALQEESARIERQTGKKPKIRLIGYSHGGNVCLNVAHVHQEEKTQNAFAVEELILIGMPVQKETDYLVADPVFKHAYHFYSREDNVQKMDCFSCNRFFSRRIFKERPTFRLPPNLTQIQIRCLRHTHTKHGSGYDINNTRNVHNRRVLNGRTPFLRNASPGHTELWFFGWTCRFYRDVFPVNPFPMVVFTPLIIAAATQFKERGLAHDKRPILVDMRVEDEMMIVRDPHHVRPADIVPFFTLDQMNSMRALAKPYVPHSHTCEEVALHTDGAYDQAKKQHREKHKTRKAIRREQRKARHTRTRGTRQTRYG
jgi:hypothetical protein